MAIARIEPVLVATRSLPFTPLTWPEPTGTRWMFCSGDRTQAVVLDADFGFVRRFDFSTLLNQVGRAKCAISVSHDGSTAVAVRWPDVFVQIRTRQSSFSTPLGDPGLSSHALVLEDACYFVQPPAELLVDNEVDDHVLVRLDFASGDMTPIASIPTNGDYVVHDAGDTLAVVAHDGQHGSTTVRVDLATGDAAIVAEIGVEGFGPDLTWFVGGGDQLTTAAWPSGVIQEQRDSERQTLFPIVLDHDRVAVWEVDDSHVLVLDRSDLRQPFARIELPSGHTMTDAHGERLVTVSDATAHLWSLGAAGS